MKKILPLLLSLTLLAGCGAQSEIPETTDKTDPTAETTASDTEPTGTTAAETTQKAAAETKKTAYDVELDCGVTVTIGGDAAAELKKVTDKLGKETDYMEAPSCVHPGSDKVYTFEGFTLTSSPDADGKEFIAELTFISDAVGFANGIMIGSTDADVTVEFGKDFTEKFGVRKYSVDGVSITFTFTDGAASAISVAVEQ